MPYRYSPLQGDEIRLLTIESIDNDADSTSPIRCILEHVSLPPKSQTPPKERFKGEDHVWPEMYGPCDTSLLFRKSPDPSAPPKGFPTAVPDAAKHATFDSEEGLPWRHSWGDYVALSYVWGSPESPETIILDGHPFSVTPNLFNALQVLRRSHRVRQGFKLWIDAICINQADMAERARQVVRMRDIYASAWHVLAYLGPAGDGSDLALAAFRWIAARIETAANPLEGFYRDPTTVNLSLLGSMTISWSSILRSDVYRAVFHLLTRQYWRRMWILQEIAMAREDGPVACGDGYLSWSQIFKTAEFIEADEGRFGRDIVAQAGPKEARHGTFEPARGRLVEERDWSPEGTWKLLQDLSRLQRAQAQAEGSGSAMDILDLLLLAREAKLTNERDRVYGILGFRMVAERVAIVPDYELSVSATYLNFGKELLSKGDLNVLRLTSRHEGSIHKRWNFGNAWTIEGKPVINSLLGPVRKRLLSDAQKESRVGHRCENDLPSWALCWACRPAPIAHLRGQYSAGGGSPTPILFAGPTLEVRGVIVDTISSLGSFHPGEVDGSYPSNDGSSPSAYGDLDATRTAFWRTVVGNTTASGGLAPESYSSLLNDQVWKFGTIDMEANGFGLHETMARNKGLMLSGYTLEELACGSEKPSSSSRPGNWKVTLETRHNLATQELEALSWAMNALAWRRLAGTSKGRMGLTCAGAKVGDSIAVLMGCNVPMVLRRHEKEDGWVVVGESYVHGIMNGEVLGGDGGEVGTIVLSVQTSISLISINRVEVDHPSIHRDTKSPFTTATVASKTQSHCIALYVKMFYTNIIFANRKVVISHEEFKTRYEQHIPS